MSSRSCFSNVGFARGNVQLIGHWSPELSHRDRDLTLIEQTVSGGRHIYPHRLGIQSKTLLREHAGGQLVMVFRKKLRDGEPVVPKESIACFGALHDAASQRGQVRKRII